MLFSFLFILFVATANICLGYFVAVRLGYGPTINPLANFAVSAVRFPVMRGSAKSSSVPAVEPSPASVAEPPESEPVVDAQTEVPTKEDRKSEASAIGVLDLSEDENEEEDTIEMPKGDAEESDKSDAEEETEESDIEDKRPANEVIQDHDAKTEDTRAEDCVASVENLLDEVTSAVEAIVEETPDDLSPFNTAYWGVTHGMSRFGAALGKLEGQLRSQARSDSSLRPLAEGINLASYNILEQLSTTLQPMMQTENNGSEMSAEQQRVHEVVDELTMKINSVLAGVINMQFDEESPAEASAALLKACENLLMAYHYSRDAFGEPLAEIARLSGNFDELPVCSYSDEQTGLIDRLGIEVALSDYRSKDPQGERPISIGIIDCDAMGKLNGSLGSLVGDSLLSAVAKLVETVKNESDTAARISGQQFLLLCADSSPNNAAQTMEKLRQSVEKSLFQSNGDEIRLTVSSAVAPMREDDTVASMLERLRGAVREAKSYGRNRTFVCDDSGSAPVVPPELEIGEQVVAI